MRTWREVRNFASHRLKREKHFHEMHAVVGQLPDRATYKCRVCWLCGTDKK